MASTPRPGQPVRGSTTGRPLMAALDLLGRRWTLRLLWELQDGPLGARALQKRCDNMSPSVLYTRLRELKEAQLVTQNLDERYSLTDLGASLAAAIKPLDQWAQSWSQQLQSSSRGPHEDPKEQ